MIIYLLWALGSLRFFFYRRLPFYPDSAYFFHYALFSPHSIPKHYDIFYLSGSRVPIIFYYRFLNWLGSILGVGHKFVEQCSHIILITLQGVLIYEILEAVGVSENLLLFPILYFGYFLPPRTFSYFGNNEIFNSLLEVIFLYAFLLFDAAHHSNSVILCGSIFITWSLLSLKFLHFLKLPIYAYFFLLASPPYTFLGVLIGTLLAIIPHLGIKSKILWRTLRSYVQSNKDHRASLLTPLHRDFALHHFPGLLCILLGFFYFPASWKWLFLLLVIAEMLIILAQHNGYPYHGIPLLKFYSIFAVFLSPWLSFALLVIYLVIGLRKPLRLFPEEFRRLDQMVLIQNEIGHYLREKLKSRPKCGLLSWGHFTAVHVLCRVPEYHGCIYAFQFIQNLEELEITYPGWKEDLQQKMRESPPEYVLIYLDGYQIMDIENISRITGFEYKLDRFFYKGRILLFKKDGVGTVQNEEFKLFSKTHSLIENSHQLAAYLSLKEKRIVVYGEDLRRQAEELFPDSEVIREDDFQLLKSLDSGAQYLLFTNSYQNDLLENARGLDDETLITKLK